MISQILARKELNPTTINALKYSRHLPKAEAFHFEPTALLTENFIGLRQQGALTLNIAFLGSLPVTMEMSCVSALNYFDAWNGLPSWLVKIARL